MLNPVMVGVCPRTALPFFRVFIAFMAIICAEVAMARGEISRSVGLRRRQTKEHYSSTRALLLEDRHLMTEGAGVKMGHVDARFKAIQADIPNWNPKLEDEAHEYSSSFITADFGSWFIRLGWEVNPARHNGDNRAYPFILTHNGTHSWYEDEVDCFHYSGDRKSLMDKPLDISVHNFTLKLRTDKTWAAIMDSKDRPIGSWKRKCNPDMQTGASFLQWGGEVGYPMSRKGQHPHTTAEMGNGLAPDAEMLGGSGYISNLHYRDNRYHTQPREPPRGGVLAAEAYGSDCYNAILSTPETITAPYLGTLFFYGGPVGSDLCGR